MMQWCRVSEQTAASMPRTEDVAVVREPFVLSPKSDRIAKNFKEMHEYF